jgi:hypothetical protein
MWYYDGEEAGNCLTEKVLFVDEDGAGSYPSMIRDFGDRIVRGELTLDGHIVIETCPHMDKEKNPAEKSWLYLLSFNGIADCVGIKNLRSKHVISFYNRRRDDSQAWKLFNIVKYDVIEISSIDDALSLQDKTFTNKVIKIKQAFYNRHDWDKQKKEMLNAFKVLINIIKQGNLLTGEALASYNSMSKTCSLIENWLDFDYYKWLKGGING